MNAYGESLQQWTRAAFARSKDWISLDIRARARQLAEAEVAAIGRHELPANTPPDLRDERPHWLAAASGNRISARLLPTDVTCGRMSPVTIVIWLLPLLYLSGDLSRLPGWGWGGVVFWIAAFVTTLVLVMRITRWPAHFQGALYYGDSEVALHTKRALARRTQQAERAARDTSPIWPVGESTGQVSGIAGADRGRQLGLSADDLATHLMCFGATGAGKTSGVLRPLAQWWSGVTDRQRGLLVLDGKGDLPREFDGRLPGFRLLVPGRDPVNLLAELEPHDIVLALTQPGAKDAEDFWIRSAGDLLYHASVIAEACAKHQLARYDLATIARIMADSKHRAGLCASLVPTLTDDQRVLTRALQFFSAGWNPETNNTQAGVLSTAQSWVTPMLRHPALLEWAAPTSANDGHFIAVADVLRGARYGLDCPEYRYGEAAAPVTALLRAQVYRAAKRRGSTGTWSAADTPCLVLVDEAALAMGPMEQAILPVARSLGVSFAAALQNIEQLEERFGGPGARALADQFRSLVALSSSVPTQEYLRLRAGTGVIREGSPIPAPAYDSAIQREATSPWRSWQSSTERVSTLLGWTVLFAPKDPSAGDTLKVGPLLPLELPLGDGEALVVLNRAGLARVETVRLPRVLASTPKIK